MHKSALKTSFFVIVTVLLVHIISLSALPATGRVFTKDANIFFDNGTKVTQLTFKSHNRSPLLSADGQNVYFLRKSTQEAYLSVGSPEDYPGEQILADQLWRYDLHSGKEILLVSDKKSANLEDVVAHIHDDFIKESTDGKRIYFITSAWVVSGAIHVVNVDGSGHKFLMPGNEIHIVQEGEYKGHLLVQQHRYFVGAGSYDWFWLFTSEGKEIGPVGQEITEAQGEVLGKVV